MQSGSVERRGSNIHLFWLIKRNDGEQAKQENEPKKKRQQNELRLGAMYTLALR